MKPDTVMTKTEFHSRKRLPGHRPHELIDFVHDGFLYTVGIGRFVDGRLAEIFINAGIAGTAIETYARDTAIAVNLPLQHGRSLENIRAARPSK
jgi:ribonucleoside-diphosphate reductase alpha chain